jgi:glutamate-1-semialdehyde aminotransferase
VIGKAIAGGLPGAAYGMRRELADQIGAELQRDEIDTGGIGGTVSGSVLSAVAIRTTLREVLTDAAFPQMIATANRWADGVDEVLARHEIAWSVTRLGARAEYHFTPEAPRIGAEAAAAVHHEMERYLHLHALNRGIIMTPFHNMALFSPATPVDAADRHTAAFEEAIVSLKEGGVFRTA